MWKGIDMDWEEINKRKYKFLYYEYTYEDIRNFETLKIYTESSHFDRKLVKDTVNNILYLYEFYERFMEDDIYTTYALVECEHDADWLNKEQNIFRKRAFRFDNDMRFIVV
jgi:hypothetical protein